MRNVGNRNYKEIIGKLHLLDVDRNKVSGRSWLLHQSKKSVTAGQWARLLLFYQISVKSCSSVSSRTSQRISL